MQPSEIIVDPTLQPRPMMARSSLQTSGGHLIMDYCSRIQQEYMSLERVNAALKMEVVEARESKLKTQEFYQNSLAKANQEVARLTAANKRMIDLLHQSMRDLPDEVKDLIQKEVTNKDSGRPLDLRDIKPKEEMDVNQPDEVSPSIKKFKSIPAYDFGATSQMPTLSAYQPSHQPSPVGLTNNKMFGFTPSPGSSSKFVPSPTSTFSPPMSSSFVSTSVSPTNSTLPSHSSAPITVQNKQSSPADDDSEEYDESSDEDTGSKRSRRYPNKMEMEDGGLPVTAKRYATLLHGDLICSVAFHPLNSRVFTGGKGSVKIWDIENPTRSLADLPCMRNAYVRTCKIFSSGKNLIVGGESPQLFVWDIEEARSTYRTRHNLNTPAVSIFGLACDKERDQFYAAYNSGVVAGWDVLSGKQTKTFTGHSTQGVSCLDISPDGTKLLSGGLDGCLKVWDIGTSKEIASYSFGSQIYSISVCPGESWVAVGLSNRMVEVFNLANTENKYVLEGHEDAVLSVKYANTGKWFISTGRDKLVHCWKSPYGTSVFQCCEPNSVLCSDVSLDDSYIVTGSGERLATVYELQY